MSSVVNVKVQYIRQNGYNNLQEWMKDPNNIYIGRQGIVFIDGQRFPKEASIFCNPYKIGKDGDREQIIKMYEIYIGDKINENPNLKTKLIEMKGKTLGCWCKPDNCHGDVLLKIMYE